MIMLFNQLLDMPHLTGGWIILAKEKCLLIGMETIHPEAVFIVAGDFNKANLRTSLPKFFQHIDCAMRYAHAQHPRPLLLLTYAMHTKPSPALSLANQTTTPSCSFHLKGKNSNRLYQRQEPLNTGPTNQKPR